MNKISKNMQKAITIKYSSTRERIEILQQNQTLRKINEKNPRNHLEREISLFKNVIKIILVNSSQEAVDFSASAPSSLSHTGKESKKVRFHEKVFSKPLQLFYRFIQPQISITYTYKRNGWRKGRIETSFFPLGR